MALAEKCHSSTSYIGEIEIGKKFPSVEMIQKIADSLNIQPYKLFMQDNDSFLVTLPQEKKELLIQSLHNAIVGVINQEEI